MAKQKHPYHIVTQSPWPIAASISSLCVAGGITFLCHKIIDGEILLLWGLIGLLMVLFGWWRDVIRESTFEGHHTKAVQKGLSLGMVLFIISEAMFFVAFFWTFFSAALNPVPNVGGVWPPVGVETIKASGLPLANTLILLSSGASITCCHNAIIGGLWEEATISLGITLFFGLIFTCLQYAEYKHAPFAMSDGVYGSLFFLITGFHGFHVVVGSLFLFVCLIRLFLGHFSQNRHFGFESAAWYWHFVDIVWLFVFVSFYWWGGAPQNKYGLRAIFLPVCSRTV